VTNELFPNERNTTPGCAFNPTPEDTTNFAGAANSGSPGSDFSSDITNFAMFMRLLAPPTPATSSTTSPTTTLSSVQVASASATSSLPAANTSTVSAASVTRGQQVFANIGCQACHITNQTTALSSFDSTEGNATFSPLSYFALHNMGMGLADGVSQGAANGNQFRTAPLWGIGQRIFFLHDGRTNDLKVAIRQHASSGSEANQVIQNFNLLSTSDQQALLNYLRSLRADSHCHAASELATSKHGTSGELCELAGLVLRWGDIVARRRHTPDAVSRGRKGARGHICQRLFRFILSAAGGMD
jgi:mono/diheme cytochrome c family protein